MSRPAQHPLLQHKNVGISLESWLVDEIAMRVKNKGDQYLPSKSKVIHRAVVEYLGLDDRLNEVIKEVNKDRAKEGKKAIHKITK